LLITTVVFLTFSLAYAFGGRARAQVQWEEVRSEALGRTVAYGTLITGPEAIAGERVVYLTDGRKLYDEGLWAEIERLTAAGEVRPAQYVLVSSIDVSGKDYRNDDFFCNLDYLHFFTKELIPAVEGKERVPAAQRSLVGISFGGLNAAWFAAMDAPFGNYGLLSPITYPRKAELHRRIAFGPNDGLRIFISTGRQDAESYVDDLLALYETKTLEVKEVRTEGAHDFANWSGQLGLLLSFLNPHDTILNMYYPSIPTSKYDRNIAFYASQAPTGSSLEEILHTSRQELIDFIEAIPGDSMDYAYGWGKWTIGEVLHHVLYYEHIMRESAELISGTHVGPLKYRTYTQSSTAKPGKGLPKSELLERALVARDATIASLLSMSVAEREKVGRHEGFRTSARVLGLCILGHQAHHFGVLRERYLR
ncbi:MAG: alpha/beta hydrolase-fold protein, partial [Bacteroidota bacterium]